MRFNSEFKERHTIMDIRREYDKRMRRECIWGAVVMVVAFGMVIISIILWG